MAIAAAAAACSTGPMPMDAVDKLAI